MNVVRMFFTSLFLVLILSCGQDDGNSKDLFDISTAYISSDDKKVLSQNKEEGVRRIDCEFPDGENSDLCLSISESKVIWIDQEKGLPAHIVQSEYIVNKWVETARFRTEDEFSLVSNIFIKDITFDNEYFYLLPNIDEKSEFKSMIRCSLTKYLSDCNSLPINIDLEQSKNESLKGESYLFAHSESKEYLVLYSEGSDSTYIHYHSN